MKMPENKTAKNQHFIPDSYRYNYLHLIIWDSFYKSCGILLLFQFIINPLGFYSRTEDEDQCRQDEDLSDPAHRKRMLCKSGLLDVWCFGCSRLHLCAVIIQTRICFHSSNEITFFIYLMLSVTVDFHYKTNNNIPDRWWVKVLFPLWFFKSGS